MRNWIMAAALALMTVAGVGAAHAADDEKTASDTMAKLRELNMFGSKKAGEELKRYAAACDNDDAEACANAGLISNNLLKGHYNSDDARIYYAKACQLNRWTACNEAGKLWAQKGRELIDQQWALFPNQCDNVSVLKCDELRKAAQKYGESSYQTAYASYDKGCRNGDPRACSNVAYAKYHGQGTEKDVPAARTEWKRVCMEGKIFAACHNYAGLLKTGEGSDEPAQPEKAGQLYAVLCKEGYRASCPMVEDEEAKTASEK